MLFDKIGRNKGMRQFRFGNNFFRRYSRDPSTATGQHASCKKQTN